MCEKYDKLKAQNSALFQDLRDNNNYPSAIRVEPDPDNSDKYRVHKDTDAANKYRVHKDISDPKWS